MSLLDKDLTENEKRIYANCLAYILNLNQNSDKAQREYLEKQMGDIGLSATKLKNIKKTKTESVIKELQGISDVRIRRFILREMILLAIADHEISDQEIETIYTIGMKTGIKQEKINDFFIWAAKGIEWQIEGSQLVDEDL